MLKILNVRENGETEVIGTFNLQHVLKLNTTIANCFDSCNPKEEAEETFTFKHQPSKALAFAMRYCEIVNGCDEDVKIYRHHEFFINPLFTAHLNASTMDDLIDILKISFFLENKSLSECAMRMIVDKKNAFVFPL